MAVPTKGTGIKDPSAPPIQVPSPEPSALNAAFPTESPETTDKTNSTKPPMTGTLLTSGPNTLAAPFTPNLPAACCAAFFPAACPNLLFAAPSPYLLAYCRCFAVSIVSMWSA